MEIFCYQPAIKHWHSHGGHWGYVLPQEPTQLLKLEPKCTKTRHFHTKNAKIFCGGAQPSPYPNLQVPPIQLDSAYATATDYNLHGFS